MYSRHLKFFMKADELGDIVPDNFIVLDNADAGLLHGWQISVKIYSLRAVIYHFAGCFSFIINTQTG